MKGLFRSLLYTLRIANHIICGTFVLKRCTVKSQMGNHPEGTQPWNPHVIRLVISVWVLPLELPLGLGSGLIREVRRLFF